MSRAGWRIRPDTPAFTIMLGALAALPPLSIDMGLPAFPELEQQFGASATGAGLTLSVFLAGFALAQLALGPLSDSVVTSNSVCPARSIRLAEISTSASAVGSVQKALPALTG